MSFILVSCASNGGDWGPWRTTDVSSDNRDWRWCKSDKDGEVYDKKGMCYWSQECRFRKTIFGNEKSECRPVLLHCAWGDISCMDKYDIFSKIITSKK